MRPIIALGRSDWRVLKRLRKLAKRDGDVDLALRCLIVLGLGKGIAPEQLAATLERGLATVYRVRARYEEHGVLGLIDRRVDNGSSKIDKEFLAKLAELVERQPTDFGWERPTWTRELLKRQMSRETGVKVSLRTLGRALKLIGAGWKRGRPCLLCPWPKARRDARIRGIRRRIARLPGDEVAFYEDEVDIHLNPKIGNDWMLRGQQKLVVTPGKNVKRYLAGVLDPKTGGIEFVEGERKASLLFIRLIEHLVKRFERWRRIHLFLDNFSIHDSRKTRQFLAALEGKVVLHFLPPYCPGDNPIEGLWRELHANVTRNHRCRTMRELMRGVRRFLRRAAPYPRSKFPNVVTRPIRFSELRPAV